MQIASNFNNYFNIQNKPIKNKSLGNKFVSFSGKKQDDSFENHLSLNLTEKEQSVLKATRTIQKTQARIQELEAQIPELKKKKNFFSSSELKLAEKELGVLKKDLALNSAFVEYSKKKSKAACIFNPDVRMKHRIAEAKENGFITCEDFSEQIPSSMMLRLCKAGVLAHVIEPTKDIYFIDTNDETTNKKLNEITSALQTSVDLHVLQDMTRTYNAWCRKAVMDGELIPLGFEDCETRQDSASELLFDLKNPTNEETMKKLVRLTPYLSPYTSEIGKKGTYIPASYLASLGYGSEEEIKEDIISGKTKGKVDQETLVSAEDLFEFRAYVESLEAKNPNRMTLMEFGKSLRISEKSLKEQIKSGNLEIIKENLFDDEGKVQRYIDISRPTNQEFVEKVRARIIPKTY